MSPSFIRRKSDRGSVEKDNLPKFLSITLYIIRNIYWRNKINCDSRFPSTTYFVEYLSRIFQGKEQKGGDGPCIVILVSLRSSFLEQKVNPLNSVLALYRFLKRM